MLAGRAWRDRPSSEHTSDEKSVKVLELLSPSKIVQNAKGEVGEWQGLTSSSPIPCQVVRDFYEWVKRQLFS